MQVLTRSIAGVVAGFSEIDFSIVSQRSVLAARDGRAIAVLDEAEVYAPPRSSAHDDPVFGQAERDQEILAEDLVGMDGGGSVVIDDFDLVRAVRLRAKQTRHWSWALCWSGHVLKMELSRLARAG